MPPTISKKNTPELQKTLPSSTGDTHGQQDHPHGKEALQRVVRRDVVGRRRELCQGPVDGRSIGLEEAGALVDVGTQQPTPTV